ncbi:GAS2-like protein pickled eggs [Galendromus occidentalis]|uniref:GAS2-like protein pickled eggs n=1 Tax=Galendromus occidentalis TaxID=34638 RepID=A0AAJ7SHD8_9ACAR|nr:GAS2-like protein pickled eggs [Galendromus occidentalis]
MSTDIAVSLGAIKVDTRSLKPFKSSDEYLWAMKEDLAEWFNDMYQVDMDAFNFFDKLEDGVILCRHANNIIDSAENMKVVKVTKVTKLNGSPTFKDLKARQFRRFTYKKNVQPGSWIARDNISHFIEFCNDLHINECLRFETDDLVLRKNEKSVILCLLEVARHGFHFGMKAPVLVKMEFEIDSQLANRTSSPESNASSGRSTPTKVNNENKTANGQCSPPNSLQSPLPNVQTVTNDLRTLHERVVELLAQCTCPTQFPMIRVREGQYRIGESKMLIFVRILRKHIMVRVGGGWDTLAHFLDKHDPCRCRFGHRETTPGVRMEKPGDHQMVKHIEFKRIMAPAPAPKEPWK